MSEPTNLSADLPPVDPDSPDAPPIEGPQVHLTFLQHPMVQNVLPLLTSLAIHLALIIIGVIAARAVVQLRTVSQEQVIVPEATMATGADIGGVPNPGLGEDPTRAAAQDQVQDTNSQGWANKPSETLQANVMAGGGDQGSDTLIGIGAGISSGKGSGVGTGQGDAGGPLAPFGVPGGGGGLGPPSNFLGSGGNARFICYVCDASGSMQGIPFDLLQMKLKESIGKLDVSQAFNVVFFQEEGKGYIALNERLELASPKNKSAAFEKLTQVTARSVTEPMPGIRFAFQQKPQLIYLLTDGVFPDNNAVIEECRKLNAQKQVKINTIGFFNPKTDPVERKQCEDMLRTIANDSGGTFKVVLTTDIYQQ